jgi:hypothetical protein
MRDWLDSSRLNLAISLHRELQRSAIPGLIGVLERIIQTLPQRLGEQGTLSRWKAERLYSDLINTHDPILAANRTKKRLLFTANAALPRMAFTRSKCLKPFR